MNLLKPRTLPDWLDYLEHCHQVEIQLGLDRVTLVADKLNLRQISAKVISVAGTNGKGSTVAALTSIYVAAGMQVASYTSPHVFSFNERICVNLQPISDEQLCEAFHAIEQARGDVHLTYFEMTTLAALWYFKQLPLDVVILEVGMGGRLDATNIIDADLAIITTVDLDHQDYLGTTIDAIGYEKSGIIRRGKPCIYADFNPPQSVLAHAHSCEAPIYCLDVDYRCVHTENGYSLMFDEQTVRLPASTLHLNAVASAVFAVYLLQDVLSVDLATIQEGLRAAKIIGRKQMVKGIVPTLFDVAHNPQAALSLSEYILSIKPKGRVLAVFSALKDKDLSGLIKPMRACVDAWYPAILSSKRAASEDMLAKAYQSIGVTDFSGFNTPKNAYRQALSDATPHDLIVVYGSFFMVSELMTKQGE